MSHTLTVPFTTTSEGAAQYPNAITQVVFTLPTAISSTAAAVAQVLSEFGGCELINSSTMLGATFS
jgi:hypothetical protein